MNQKQTNMTKQPTRNKPKKKKSTGNIYKCRVNMFPH